MSGNCNSSSNSFMPSAESLIHLESSTPDSGSTHHSITHNLDSISVRDSKSCPSHDPLPLLQPSSYRSSSSSQSIPQFLSFYQLHQTKKATTRAQQHQRRLSKSCNKSPPKFNAAEERQAHAGKRFFSFFFPFQESPGFFFDAAAAA